MPNQRQMRVARRLQEEISRILLREIDDPLVRMVTLTDVDVSPDLKHARVWFSVVGEGEDDPEQVLKGLRRARKFIQGRLADEGELRYVPMLDFRFDATAQRAQRVEAILRQLAESGQLKPAEEPDAPVAEPDEEDDDDLAP
jgi:ribosome-binding factor A